MVELQKHKIPGQCWEIPYYMVRLLCVALAITQVKKECSLLPQEARKEGVVEELALWQDLDCLNFKIKDF